MAVPPLQLSVVELFQLDASLNERRQNLEGIQRSLRAKRKGPKPSEYEATVEVAIHVLRKIETKVGEALNNVPRDERWAGMSA